MKTLTVGNDSDTSTFNGTMQDGLTIIPNPGIGAATSVVGTLALTKTGTGTLTLNGMNTATGALAVNQGQVDLNTTGTNAWSGNAVVNTTGTLRILQANQIADSRTITVAGGTLNLNTFNETVAGVSLTASGLISGAGSTLTSTTDFDLQSGTASVNLAGAVGLIKTTAGTAILSVDNSYTLATTISAGTLQIGAGGSTGSVGGGNITNDGTLSFNRTDNYGGSYAKVINGSGNVVVQAGTLTLSALNGYSGTTTIGAGASVLIANDSALGATTGGTTVATGANLTLSGGTTVGAEALTLNGDGISSEGALLNAGGTNTYGGAITAATSAKIVAAGSSILNLAGITNAGTTVTFAGGGTINIGGAIDGTGAGSNVGVDATTVVYNATNTYTGTTTIQNSGLLRVGAGGRLGSGNVTNNATLTFNRADAYGGDVANVISGSGVVNVEAGVLTLSGASTYSGATNVNGGTLRVNGSLSNTTGVLVASGATLGGTGSINAPVTIATGGHFAPGASVGTTTVNSLTLASNSILDFEFNTLLGTPNDRIIVSTLNGLTINGGQFNLYNEGALTTFSTNGTYDLLQYSGTIGGTGLGALSVLNQDPLRTYTFGTSGGWLQLTIGDASGNYWAPVAGGGGSGTWTSSSMVWAASASSPTPGITGQGPGPLVFTDAAGTVTVSGTVATAGGMSISTDGYLFTGGQIDLTGTASANTISVVGSGVTTQFDSKLNVSNGLTKSGAGTLVLTNATNVIPAATVNAGLLRVSGGGALNSGANLTVAASATATFLSSAAAPSLGTVTADGAVNIETATAAIVTLNGAIGGSMNLGANTVLTVNDGTLNGNLTGLASSQLIKDSAGTLTLGGTNSGFLGTTTINNGTLSLSSPIGGQVTVNTGGSLTGAGASGSTVTNAGGSNTVSGNNAGNVNQSSGSTTYGPTANVSGATNITGGSLTVQGIVSGSFTQSGTSTSTFENGSQLTGGATISGGTFTAQNGSTIATNGGSGIIVNGGTVNFASGATVTGSGPIAVNGGTLSFNATNTAVDVNVASGGTLKGTGSVGDITVASGGAVSPGNSVGTETATGLNLTGGSIMYFEFGNVAGNTPGTSWDLIELNGGLLDLGNASAINPIVININALGLDGVTHDNGSLGANSGTFNPNSTTPQYWLFVHSTNVVMPEYDMPPDDDLSRRFLINDDIAGSGVFGTGNAFMRPTSSLGQGTFSVAFGSYGAGGPGLYITYSAIPEPGSMALCGLGALAAGWYGKRRLKKNAAAAAATESPNEGSNS